MPNARNILDGFERWLRIDRDGRLEDVTRARGVYVVAVTMALLQALNLVLLLVSYGSWSMDAWLSSCAGLLFALSVPALRWTKRFGLFAAFYILLSFAGVAGAAIQGGGGVNTSLLPFLTIGPLIVGYLFNWRAALAYGVLGLVFTTWLYGVSLGNDNFGPASGSIWLFQRYIQAVLAITIGTVVAINLSRNVFTAIRRVEDSLALAREAEAAKSQFLATMSHELRTPLNGIIGMSEVLCAADLPEREREMAETIRRSGHALLAIIGDLLDLSKIEAGKMEVEEAPFSPHDLLAHVVRSWEETATGKGLLITAEIASDLPAQVIGDELRTGQILQNLVSNAVKFTHEGAVKLTLSAEKDDGRPSLVCRVQDTGSGVPPMVQDTIFDAFSQGETGTTRRYGGTGLGLPICRQLAGLMGGRIDLERSDGTGSVFALTLPLRPAATRSAPGEQGRDGLAPSPALTGKRVLVAEDNEVNRLVIGEFLKHFGASTVFAHNGEETLEALGLDCYDLLLLDKHMPGISGLEVAAMIRGADAPWRNLPIIAVTADAVREEVDQIFAHGIDGYVPKPIRPDVLRRTMEEVLLRRQRGQTGAA